jgi:hypothetical protein
VKDQRASSVHRRELSQLQRRAIRILIAEPGVTFKSIADRIHVDRSAVSRWAHHDALFIAELESAQAAPRERLSAEDALERLAPGEQERLTVLLAQDGRAQTPSRLRQLRELIESIESAGDQRDIIYELFDVLADTMVKWQFATSHRAADVCRGILEMRKELNGLLMSVTRYGSNRSDGREPEYDPDLLTEQQEINRELALVDGIENGDVQDGSGDP